MKTATAMRGVWMAAILGLPNVALGQEDARTGGAADGPAPSAAASKPTLTAVLELVSGEEREGAVEIKGGAVVVTPEGGRAITTGLAELARFKVSLRQAKQDGPSGLLLAGALPAPWRSKDVGRTMVPGKARWKEGQFVVSASPEQDDERFAAFHMVYRPMTGDGEIVARVVSLDNKDEGSQAGIVMCDGLTPEHRKAVLGVRPHGEKGVDFRRWGYQGGSTTGEDLPSLKLPYWVKLVREKYDVSAYYSPDGHRWRLLKVSPGRMRDEQIYVGLAVRVEKSNGLSDAVIDNVSVNGVGNKQADPLLPHIVLRSGSRLAADPVKGNSTAIHLGGRWVGTAITVPQIARVEFFHPLADDLDKLVQGDRAGLLLRSGDFAEGAFESLGEGRIRAGSVLFGSRDYSILDEVDCLVLRKVVEAPAAFRVETRAGSVLLAQRARLDGDKLVLEVAGLDVVRYALDELVSFTRVADER